MPPSENPAPLWGKRKRSKDSFLKNNDTPKSIFQAVLPLSLKKMTA